MNPLEGSARNTRQPFAVGHADPMMGTSRTGSRQSLVSSAAESGAAGTRASIPLVCPGSTRSARAATIIHRAVLFVRWAFDPPWSCGMVPRTPSRHQRHAAVGPSDATEGHFQQLSTVPLRAMPVFGEAMLSSQESAAIRGIAPEWRSSAARPANAKRGDILERVPLAQGTSYEVATPCSAQAAATSRASAAASAPGSGDTTSRAPSGCPKLAASAALIHTACGGPPATLPMT